MKSEAEIQERLDDLEKELIVLVSVRERSVGLSLKRTNYKIAELHNKIAVAEKKEIAKRVLVADDLAWAKVHLSLEDYLDTEFSLLRVTPHITHLKQEDRCFYSFVTVATPKHEEYRHLDIVLSTIYLEGSLTGANGSDLDRLIVERFAGLGCGASPCHAIDNFSRKRGRVIAKGRLLKVLRQERTK